MEYDDGGLRTLLNTKDYKWYSQGCPIDRQDDVGGWQRLETVQDKIATAYKSGKLRQKITIDNGFVAPRVSVISDDMGTKGVLNPADDKMYDSRAAYYKAVKSKGLEIMGSDAPTKRATPKTKTIDWKQAVAETLNKTP